MTREELMSSISAELGQTQVSERTIGEMIDTLNLADNESITQETISPYVSFLKGTVTGNISAVAASAVKTKDTEIASLNAKIAELEKQVKKEPPTENLPNDELAKIRKEFEEFKNAQTAKEEQQKISALRSDIKSAFKKKLSEAKIAVNDYVLNNTIKDFEVTKDTKVSDAVKSLESSYVENLKEAGLDGKSHPKFGNRQGSQESSATKDYFAKKKAKEGWGQKKD